MGLYEDPEPRIVAATNRLSVWPAQILSYSIGGTVIRELPSPNARAGWVPSFDVRHFHDAVLRDGPIPLDVLQRRVRAQCTRG